MKNLSVILTALVLAFAIVSYAVAEIAAAPAASDVPVHGGCAFADADGFCDNGDSHCATDADENDDGVCDVCGGNGLHESTEDHSSHASDVSCNTHSSGSRSAFRTAFSGSYHSSHNPPSAGNHGNGHGSNRKSYFGAAALRLPSFIIKESGH